ncbi:MAG: hypothetical protein ACYC4Q_09780 [Victivallaceae bacterium]
MKNYILVASIAINLVLTMAMIYFYCTSPAAVKVEVIKYPDGKIAKIIKTINIAIGEGYGFAQIETFKLYYTTGHLRLEGYWINGNWELCRVYSPDGSGKLISAINCGRGAINIPDNNGKFSPANTFYPMGIMNCYYRHGEPLTKQEYDAREKLQDDRIKKLNIGIKF